MALYDEIQTKIVTAMKAGDSVVLGTLRLLKNAVDIKVKDGAELTDDLVIATAQSETKKRHEASALYRQGGAVDKADAEEAEAAVLAQFLPAQASAEDVNHAIDEIIAATGATTPADMGKVMGALKARFGASIDLGAIGSLVRERLNG